MKVTEKVPVKKMVGKINATDLPFGGEWIYELEPQGSNTIVRITENGEVYNPPFRFISKYIIGHSSTLKKYLGYLEASF